MHHRGLLLIVVWAGCGWRVGDAADTASDELNMATFDEAYVEAYCDAWSACDTSGAPCPVTSEGDATGACTFDLELAEACLAGAFTCDASAGAGQEVVVPPIECETVCGETTTTTGTPPTTTAPTPPGPREPSPG